MHHIHAHGLREDHQSCMVSELDFPLPLQLQMWPQGVASKWPVCLLQCPMSQWPGTVVYMRLQRRGGFPEIVLFWGVCELWMFKPTFHTQDVVGPQ